jgi:hypothetical protein
MELVYIDMVLRIYKMIVYAAKEASWMYFKLKTDTPIEKVLWT